MVTQLDIARKLGISRQLVTFALANYPQVAPTTRKRIQATALQMGYQPNPHARALKEGKTSIVALWIPNQISSHFDHVTREMTRLVKKDQFELIVSEVDASAASKVLSHVPTDAIFVVDAPSQILADLVTRPPTDPPIISMGANCCPNIDYVKVDLFRGARQATRHLIQAGYHRIAHMTFIREGADEQDRRQGYLATMKQAGLTPEFIYYPLSYDQRPLVRHLIQEYLQKHGRPEAIFCHSDDVAVGVYRGLCDLGLRVPADVALIGCDGIQDTEYLECPITTLIQPVQEMCAAAWQLFQNRLTSPGRKPQHRLLNPTLVPRKSTRRQTESLA